jgi:hypothetical protein
MGGASSKHADMRNAKKNLVEISDEGEISENLCAGRRLILSESW